MSGASHVFCEVNFKDVLCLLFAKVFLLKQSSSKSRNEKCTIFSLEVTLQNTAVLYSVKNNSLPKSKNTWLLGTTYYPNQVLHAMLHVTSVYWFSFAHTRAPQKMWGGGQDGSLLWEVMGFWVFSRCAQGSLAVPEWVSLPCPEPWSLPRSK